MIASSAFVLTALTITGVYMQARDTDSQDDGYTIDFSALENTVDNKEQEILEENSLGSVLPQEGLILPETGNEAGNVEDDLDYPPLEAGSGLVEIPGLTDQEEPKEDPAPAEGLEADPSGQPKQGTQEETPVTEGDTTGAETPAQTAAQETGAEDGQTAMGETVLDDRQFHFAENSKLIPPLAGELVTILPFNRDVSVYFQTLDQYKRNYAMVLSAAEEEAVTACADGRVLNVFSNEEIGHAVTVELGDGYQITYGQLKDIQVAPGSYVTAGQAIGVVAPPTRYYIKEGSNLYLQLTCNGTAIDPAPLF